MKVLLEFYIDQYRSVCRQSGAKARMQKYQHKINAKINQIKNTHASYGREEMVCEFHKDVKRLAQAAYFSNNKEFIRKINTELLPELVRMDVETLTKEEAELVTAKTIEGLRREMPYEICKRTLKTLSRNYFELDIKKQIIHMVPANPEQEFPEAIEMERTLRQLCTDLFVFFRVV